jgi:membrane protease YdiL (CAAX protease family)
MRNQLSIAKNKPGLELLGPLGVYVFVVCAITALRRFLPGFVIPLSAVLLFSAPFVMKSNVSGLKPNLDGVLLGSAVSVVILSLYVIIVDKPVQLGRVSYSLVILQLFLVAVPEEVFFRGYLQEKIGNDLRGVLAVSLLFAIGHFVTGCVGGGLGGASCAKTLLTFFPSIVMGYMYATSGTLWGNIMFHFLSNIVYEATGGL